ncbi:MAG TPA: ABC transporter permease, partial [Puia sp.]|nr:ABC transporter permease [Puia sp.]
MLSNHIKAAWRNLLKQKQFTFLNLVGLSSGLACVILIFLWVNDEIHIDKFNRNNSRLYQVLKNSPDGDGSIITRETTQGLLSQELLKSYPEIEYAVSVKKEGELGVLSVDQKLIKASWEFADKDFFHVFSYRLMEGNASRILADPYGVLVSDKLARKLFNTTKNIIGKTISWDAGSEFSGSYMISGIFEAPPTNASDQFDLVFSYALYVEKEKGGMGDINFWGSNSICT